MNLKDQYITSRDESWKELDKEVTTPYFTKLDTLYTTLSKDNSKAPIYPQLKDIFNVYKHPIYKYRVLILGQDPYHSKSEDKGIICTADGYAFSTRQKDVPPSLKVIFDELERSYRKKRLNNNLSDWVEQGVLLLNTALTVEINKANSHSKIGWQYFTIRTIVLWLKSRMTIKDKSEPTIVVLWGNYAKDVWGFIEDNIKDLDQIDNLLVLKSAHPAADKHGSVKLFTGNNHFIEINNYISAVQGKECVIDFIGNDYSKPYIECLYSKVVDEEFTVDKM